MDRYSHFFSLNKLNKINNHTKPTSNQISLNLQNNILAKYLEILIISRAVSSVFQSRGQENVCA